MQLISSSYWRGFQVFEIFKNVKTVCIIYFDVWMLWRIYSLIQCTSTRGNSTSLSLLSLMWVKSFFVTLGHVVVRLVLKCCLSFPSSLENR